MLNIASACKTINALLPARHQLILASLCSGLLIAVTISKFSGNPDSRNTSVVIRTLPVVHSEKSTFDYQSFGSDLQLREPDKTTIIDNRKFLDVQAGDNLSLLFDRAGLGPREVFAISNSSPDAARLAELFPGDRLAFDVDADTSLKSLEVIKSPLESYVFTRTEAGQYRFTLIEKYPDLELVFKEALITDSLFQAAERGGIPARLALELAGIFGGVVDFILDTREGDSFNLVYEEKHLDGDFIGYGQILAAQFVNQGETFTAVRYENANGDVNFYNPEGESMRKAFLLNPVDFTRISSGFTLSRRHPLLNTLRAHKGTDYAAPTGTPVVATADGTITFSGRNGSFGKLVVIQHSGNFETKYAHLNDYAKGISKGAKITQGQVIGYVGSTGGATGPHLHYEFLMDGVHRNSRTIHDQLPRAESIPASEMPRFRQQVDRLITLLASKGQTANTIVHNSVSPTEE